MLNHDKAYILGLITGGGRLDRGNFIIELPFKKWGMDPHKMNDIAIDILTKISKKFKNEYSMNVGYEIGNSKWIIKPVKLDNYNNLLDDLKSLNLPTSGFLLNTADLSEAKKVLSGIKAESFLSGIFDSRASITLSHRRFNSDAPVVSIEIPGSTGNFKFVVQICSWLTDLGSTTDQILYNHPNQHSSSDPYYTGWKKGFKIRFLIKSFLAKHSFALQAKSIDAKLIEKNQKREEQLGCPFRKIKKPSPISIHEEMDSSKLPQSVRNKIFFHYFHFCSELGCEHAPNKEVDNLMKEMNSLITFFPRLSKGDKEELWMNFQAILNSHFKESELKTIKISVNNLLTSSSYQGYYGLEQGLAYLCSKKLNGKRHSGPMQVILDDNRSTELELSRITKELEPIFISNPKNGRAIICSDVKSMANQKLIKSHIEENKRSVLLK